MKIFSREMDDVTVLTLDGGLGYDNYKTFKKDVEPFVTQPGQSVVVDLDRVTYLSSWGIGALVSLSGEIHKNGGDVTTRLTESSWIWGVHSEEPVIRTRSVAISLSNSTSLACSLLSRDRLFLRMISRTSRSCGICCRLSLILL